MKQVALVTGAARGIGRAAAVALAKQGFSVALNDRGVSADLNDSVEACRSYGVSAKAFPFDVSNLEAHAQALEAISIELGEVTALVNNAGVGVMERGDPLNVTEESFDRCIAVNTKAMFFLMQAFARRYATDDSDASIPRTIVNVTSSNAVAVAEPRSEYCVSKAGAAMASKAFAVRLGRAGVAVYDVQPGLIATDMTAPVIDAYQARAEGGLTVMPRVGKPEEVGEVIANLALGCLPYTTGHVVSVDGGLLVSRY